MRGKRGGEDREGVHGGKRKREEKERRPETKTERMSS